MENHTVTADQLGATLKERRAAYAAEVKAAAAETPRRVVADFNVRLFVAGDPAELSMETGAKALQDGIDAAAQSARVSAEVLARTPDGWEVAFSA